MEFYITRANDDELMHYGVKGMKWGIRRYQNKDGSLTAEAKRRAKQEYREDNKKAFELGKNATLYGHASAKSMNRTIKLENKLDKQYEKDPHGVNRRTQSLRKKWDASSKTTRELVETYRRQADLAEQHCKELIRKYGKEAVADIKYTEKKLAKGEYSPTTFRTMNEDTSSVTDHAITAGVNLASAGMSMLLGCPYVMLAYNKSTGQKAAELESNWYGKNRKEQHNK